MTNHFKVATGKNFSGRSEFLKMQCKDNSKGIYIGEIPSNYISGISPTVKAELELFSARSENETLSAVNSFLNSLDFQKLFDNNPYLLSGGEQTILTILSGLLVQPKVLAIDTVIEQLSKEWREPLLHLFQNKLKTQQVVISDNRIKEYGIDYNIVEPIKKGEHEYKFERPDLIEIDYGNPASTIGINDLTFEYKKNTPVLKNVNLTLEPGNIYFLKGTNGAGKSTLAKLLSGILKAKEGKIYANDNPVDPYKNPGQLFGYSFQNPDEQLFSKTVLNEIAVNKQHELYTKKKKFLQLFGLENLQHVHPAELPFVMRKRISLAATLTNERPWYIIDEPTIGQDDDFVNFLAHLFKRLAKKGKGVIIISHSQGFINKFDSKILYLENGYLKI